MAMSREEFLKLSGKAALVGCEKSMVDILYAYAHWPG